MSSWRLLPGQSPDLLPSFRAGIGVLCVALCVLLGLGGAEPGARALAPLLFGLAALVPVPAAPLLGVAVLGPLLTLLWAGPGQAALGALLLGGSTALGTGARAFLRPMEWTLAASRVLGAMHEGGQTPHPQQALGTVLALVRELSGAQAVVALRQQDEVSAVALVALAEQGLSEALCSLRLVAGALAGQRSLFQGDYTRAPGASPFLLARGVRALAVLPLGWGGPGPGPPSQGALLLAWSRRVDFHAHLRGFLEPLRGALRPLLQLTDTAAHSERLQARYGAILEAVPHGVVFMEASGEQGWVNRIAAEMLGVEAGALEPGTLAQAMARLRSRASNPEEIAAQGARLYAEPQAELRDWLWTFQQPREWVLRLSTLPTQLGDLPGRLWLLEDITSAWQEQRARRAVEEALRLEQHKSELLLLNVLPQSIARRLKQEPLTIAEHFPEASILFADLVDFTRLAADISPAELVSLLNTLFSEFDRLTEKHGLEKIKTIGDAYMVAGGLPTPDPRHAEAVAEMALDMMDFVRRFNSERGTSLRLRTGLHTGPVIAGVIGTRRFSYDLWGDTVNTASRMESHGLPDHIHVTQAIYERLRDRYVFSERGPIPIKGKGEMTTYLLEGRRG